MMKLEFIIPELEQIEINGDVFDIHKSDIDILNKGAEISARFSKIDITDTNPKNVELIRGLANEVKAYIDEILGKGAVAKICKGKPVSTKAACDLLTAICGKIGEQSDEYIDEKYG